jgi:hypothetical protein
MYRSEDGVVMCTKSIFLNFACTLTGMGEWEYKKTTGWYMCEIEEGEGTITISFPNGGEEYAQEVYDGIAQNVIDELGGDVALA